MCCQNWLSYSIIVECGIPPAERAPGRVAAPVTTSLLQGASEASDRWYTIILSSVDCVNASGLI